MKYDETPLKRRCHVGTIPGLFLPGNLTILSSARYQVLITGATTQEPRMKNLAVREGSNSDNFFLKCVKITKKKWFNIIYKFILSQFQTNEYYTLLSNALLSSK